MCKVGYNLIGGRKVKRRRKGGGGELGREGVTYVYVFGGFYLFLFILRDV